MRLPVPDRFDASRGWSTTASPEAPDVQAGSSGFSLVAIAPRSNLVVQAAADGSRVQAYDLATGKVAWTFIPAALSDARTGVFVMTTGGREQILLARQGKTSGDGLHQSGSTATVDIIPVDSPAKATAARHLDLPVAGWVRAGRCGAGDAQRAGGEGCRPGAARGDHRRACSSHG